MNIDGHYVDPLPDGHPLREVFRTLVEIGLEDSPMFARLEHVGDELRTLLDGLRLIANGHADPQEVAIFTLAEADQERTGGALSTDESRGPGIEPETSAYEADEIPLLHTAIEPNRTTGGAS